MNLPFFHRAFVTRLRESAGANLSRYGKGAAWLQAFASGHAYIHESNQLVDQPPILLHSGGDSAQHDATNAKRIYTWLSHLDPAIAMEERLWACLTHDTFHEYMQARWPVEASSTILRRYLFEGNSFASLSRNGIARLWWAGYLTKDDRRDNPFELTDTLFMRQDIQVSLLERAIGKCRKVRMGVLSYLASNHELLSEVAFGRRIQVLLKEVNLLGGVAVLDALPQEDIDRFLVGIGNRIISDGDDVNLSEES